MGHVGRRSQVPCRAQVDVAAAGLCAGAALHHAGCAPTPPHLQRSTRAHARAYNPDNCISWGCASLRFTCWCAPCSSVPWGAVHTSTLAAPSKDQGMPAQRRIAPAGTCTNCTTPCSEPLCSAVGMPAQKRFSPSPWDALPGGMPAQRRVRPSPWDARPEARQPFPVGCPPRGA
eukprot:366333-Chlamydomonas_euryale.AAC.1